MRWTLRLLVSVAWLVSCYAPTVAWSAEPSAASDTTAGADFSGIECIHKIGAVMGKPVDVIRLLTSKKLRPQGDILISDVATIAEENGLRGDAYQNLTPTQLRHANFPAILRVRGSRYSAKPDHYIVCLSIEDDKAHIFNPPASEKVVPVDCLATRWQGDALILHALDVSQPVAEGLARDEAQFARALGHE